MEYGLIGNPLKHSFSKEVHSLIANYNYELKELDNDSFDIFMQNKDFKAINVTIPYKQKVIPYLDYIDDSAKNINAVNTIVNINGKLHGYNTDILGVLASLSHFNVNIDNKNVLILGTGATSNTVYHAVMSANNNKNTILKAYRVSSKIKGDILYSELDKVYNDIQIIINTTSNGMYPHENDNQLIDISKFTKLEAVMDVVYNPLKTNLLISAEKIGIKAISGLYMLIAQAIYANILFINAKEHLSAKEILSSIDNKEIENQLNDVYIKCLSDKQNIVLIGMPTCGKSTLGKMISNKYGYKCIDTDKLIEEKIKCKISDYIKTHGEESFRNIETEIIKSISSENHVVISTGGGAILRNENVVNLKQNGKLFFINRSLELLMPSSDRPLTSDIDSLKKKFNERLPIYKSVCDIEINGDLEFEDKINDIINGN